MLTFTTTISSGSVVSDDYLWRQLQRAASVRCFAHFIAIYLKLPLQWLWNFLNLGLILAYGTQWQPLPSMASLGSRACSFVSLYDLHYWQKDHHRRHCCYGDLLLIIDPDFQLSVNAPWTAFMRLRRFEDLQVSKYPEVIANVARQYLQQVSWSEYLAQV